jgi:putative N-acetyltransferase (TIGR04045 family)
VAGDAEIVCRLALDHAERATCARIRAEVFVREQGIFFGSDRDERDDDLDTLHIVAVIGDQVVGTVRIYRLDAPGLWHGDRLAVSPEMRHSGLGLGRKLVCCAVRTAGELGGSEMVAYIQLANVAFFERLGWRKDGEPAPYHGVPHQQMRIPLSADPSPG